jgi:transposase
MRRFVEGTDRGQSTLFPECLEDWICEDNPVRVIDVFVEGLDLAEHGFSGVDPEATGRPSYHPSVLLKLYIYGYLSRVQSSRRLEREAGRNVEVMWLTGRLVPDHKTIADFRKDNGLAIRKVCARFVALCRELGLLTTASVAIDGSKFKAVNNRDKNFTRAKMERRVAQIEESVARYLSQLDTADLQEPSEALAEQDGPCQRLMTVPGIGPIISSAVVAAIGNGTGFGQGRDFGAWLGLVPKQESTGDRTILGKISKRGNKYLRTLFVQAAHVILARRPSAAMRGLWPWIEQASKRLHRNMLAIALANKLARIAWAVLAHGREYQPRIMPHAA